MYLSRQKQICSYGTRFLAVHRNYVSKKNVELPDYNTNVNIHEHKLTRPVAKPKDTEEKWKGLKGLQSRTKVNIIACCQIHFTHKHIVVSPPINQQNFLCQYHEYVFSVSKNLISSFQESLIPDSIILFLGVSYYSLLFSQDYSMLFQTCFFLFRGKQTHIARIHLTVRPSESLQMMMMMSDDIFSPQKSLIPDTFSMFQEFLFPDIFSVSRNVMFSESLISEECRNH